MNVEIDRPDLSRVEPAVRSYIEALETEIERLRRRSSRPPVKAGIREDEIEEPYIELEPDEPPTTINLITATASGIAKRTPRHLYSRQRRGGMGVFDLEAPEDEAPAILGLVDEAHSLLLITDLGRAFRLPVSLIREAEVRGRGESITARLNLGEGERLGAILPILAQGYVVLVGQTGMVRLLRHHVFGEYMKPGAALFDTRSFSRLAGACWTPGDGDLFIVSKQGRAIRFSEKLVPPQGCLGLRLSDGDIVVGVAGVYEDSGVFLIGEDGRGTIRLMEGFSPNKAPGAGGKIAMATDHLIGAARVERESDIFIISNLSKIIRFRAAEVPAKEGVVQGVNCMSFRGDGAAAMAVTMPESVL
jgi:DNA gyrase subunit A